MHASIRDACQLVLTPGVCSGPANRSSHLPHPRVFQPMGSSAVPWGEQQMSSSPATAAVMVHSKLTSEAGMASAAAQSAKLELQKKNQQELLAAALTPPQQRTQIQIESLCDFLSTVHLLRNVQPTALKSLAHAMSGQLHAAGEAIYRQGEAARHLFVVLSGEVVMYEHDTQHSLQDTQDTSAVSADSTATPGAHGTSHSSGRGSGQGSRLGSSSGLRTQQSPRPQRTGSPSTHKPGSPRRPGSTAGGRSSASTPSPAAAAAARSPRAVDGGGRQHSEVRRVRPREAFGEDEVTAGGQREQTAVSVAATRSTFACSTAASSSPGGKAAGAAATSSSSSSSTAGGVQQQTGALSASGAAAAAAATDSSSAAPAAPAVLASGAAAAAASDPRSQCVVLVLSAEDYGAALEGRLTSLLEEKATFLSGLPAMKGLNMHYLRTLAHCFHQVIFEPREVVVRQGDVSDCMYVLKSGQVCILIDPSLTLAETTAADDSSGDGSRKGPGHGSSSGGGGGGTEGPLSNEVDTKKLVQVCLLGCGAIIGDMSVRESAGGPPRRSATVVALTELVTFKVPLKEFVRRMPADVLEGMRQVANQKLEMNGSKAQGRALANGRDGHVLLGGLTLPEGVLHGKGLRALMDVQQQVAPVGGLIQALELCVASDSSSTCKGKTGGAGSGPRQHPSKKWFVSGSKAAQEVDGFVDSLSRNGFLAAPPTEFLVLMADWRSARTNNSSQQQQVPPGWVFPLPVPSKSPTRATAATSNSHLHPAVGTLAPLAHAASCGAGPWDDPAVTTHTVYASRPQTPQHAASGSVQQTSGSMTAAGPAQELGSMATCVGAGAQTAAEGGAARAADATGLSGLASHPLMSSPTSLLAALSLDLYAQQSPLASPCSSRHGSRPATPAGTSSGSKSLNGAAVVKDAAQQLLLGGGLLSPKATCHAAGGMGGRGQLLRGPLGQQGLPACVDAGGKAATAGKGAVAAVKAGAYTTPFAVGPGSSKEPSIEEASIKAAVLFRPGSPITIGRCGSLQSPTHGSSRVAAAADHAGTPVLPPSLVLEGLAPNVHAAVVTNRTGKQELTFHCAAGPAVAIQMTR